MDFLTVMICDGWILTGWLKCHFWLEWTLTYILQCKNFVELSWRFSIYKKDFWGKILNVYCAITKQWNWYPNSGKSSRFIEELKLICHFVEIQIIGSKILFLLFHGFHELLLLRVPFSFFTTYNCLCWP